MEFKTEYIITGIVALGISLALILIPSFQTDKLIIIDDSTSGNTTVAFDDLTDVVIFNAISGQIVVYNGTYWNNVNATTFSDTTTCNNLGSGTFICAGDNVNLKSLKASLGLSISNDSTSITYRTNFANGTGVSITGSGLQTFTNTLPEATSCSNVGTGNKILKTTPEDCVANSLIAGTGITIGNTTDDYTITNSLPESTACFSAGIGIATLCAEVPDNIRLKSIGGLANAFVNPIVDADTVFIGALSTVATHSACGTVSTNTDTDLILINSTSCTTNVNLYDVEVGNAKDGNIIMIKKIDTTTGNVLINTAADDRINGLTTIRLTGSRDAIILTSGSTLGTGFVDKWNILSILNGTNLVSDNTVCTNLGASSSLSEGIYVSGECDFKKLLEGANIALSSNGTHVTIATTGLTTESTSCSNVGSGSFILKTTAEDCVANSLIAGTGITISNTTDDYTIASTVVGNKQVAQLTFITTEDVTKTNLSTSYVDVYATLWDQEEQALIIGENVTYVRVLIQYDFVGAGSDQCRLVDAANNANVVWESATFNVDQNSLDSTWVAKPAFLSAIIAVELQCKSSNGTNDPVVHGYEVFIK